MRLSGFRGGGCSAITKLDVEGDAFRHLWHYRLRKSPHTDMGPTILRHFRSSIHLLPVDRPLRIASVTDDTVQWLQGSS